MRRPPAGRAVACWRRVVRAAPAGAGAVAALLLAMSVVLHQVGAWPFAREDVPPFRSVPDARLPLPPPAADPGGPASGGEAAGADPAPGGPGGPEPGMDGTGMSGPGGNPPGMSGAGAGRADCGCRASWHADGRRGDFTVSVRIVNTGEAPARGWRITWTWPGRQRLVKGWNAEFRESGTTVTVRNSSNAGIPVGGGTTFGLQATHGGAAAPRLACHAF